MPRWSPVRANGLGRRGGEQVARSDISIDGSHAELTAVPVGSLRRKPRSMSFQQAAATGLTYLAALARPRRIGRLAPGETLLVIGAHGGVGSAAAQIGKWRGARVLGVVRHRQPGNASGAAVSDEVLVLKNEPLGEIVRAATNGRGADVVFDTVGGRRFEPSYESPSASGPAA